MLTVSREPLFRRRVGDQVGIAVVDLRLLRPDFAIEAGRQSGFQLRIGEAGDAGIVRHIACTLMRIADTARVQVPIGIRDLGPARVLPNKAAERCARSTGYRADRIRKSNRADSTFIAVGVRSHKTTNGRAAASAYCAEPIRIADNCAGIQSDKASDDSAITTRNRSGRVALNDCPDASRAAAIVVTYQSAHPTRATRSRNSGGRV